MNPTQIHGLMLCMVLTGSLSILTPALWWVLPNRWG
jgi:hypothetical protein